MPGAIARLAGVSELAGRYDGFILDVWGVIHDGVGLFPGVVDCLDRLAAAGKRSVMLTNAPRRGPAVVETLRALGLPGRHCGDVVSSGEATFADLSERSAAVYAGAGDRFVHIGPDRDRGLFEGLDWTETRRLGEAGLVVNTGPWEDDEEVSDYEELLGRIAALGLPMVCANPDLSAVRGGRPFICAGALAQRYEELGGAVRHLGKPRAEIYDYCFRALQGIGRPRIAAIGDSFRTDIVGARNAGIASVLAECGMHGRELRSGGDPEGTLARLADSWGARPVATIPSLMW